MIICYEVKVDGRKIRLYYDDKIKALRNNNEDNNKLKNAILINLAKEVITAKDPRKSNVGYNIKIHDVTPPNNPADNPDQYLVTYQYTREGKELDCVIVNTSSYDENIALEMNKDPKVLSLEFSVIKPQVYNAKISSNVVDISGHVSSSKRNMQLQTPSVIERNEKAIILPPNNVQILDPVKSDEEMIKQAQVTGQPVHEIVTQTAEELPNQHEEKDNDISIDETKIPEQLILSIDDVVNALQIKVQDIQSENSIAKKSKQELLVRIEDIKKDIENQKKELNTINTIEENDKNVYRLFEERYLASEQEIKNFGSDLLSIICSSVSNYISASPQDVTIRIAQSQGYFGEFIKISNNGEVTSDELSSDKLEKLVQTVDSILSKNIPLKEFVMDGIKNSQNKDVNQQNKLQDVLAKKRDRLKVQLKGLTDIKAESEKNIEKYKQKSEEIRQAVTNLEEEYNQVVQRPNLQNSEAFKEKTYLAHKKYFDVKGKNEYDINDINEGRTYHKVLFGKKISKEVTDKIKAIINNPLWAKEGFTLLVWQRGKKIPTGIAQLREKIKSPTSTFDDLLSIAYDRLHGSNQPFKRYDKTRDFYQLLLNLSLANNDNDRDTLIGEFNYKHMSRQTSEASPAQNKN